MESETKMLSTWWFLWLMFMLFFLVPSVGYGWGYRGWGPPYPNHIQRRRMRLAATNGGTSSFNHQSWGWFGDMVWVMLIVWTMWAVGAFFWWR
jgi:1-acyl-sn-glycerol-3-phosphate acyltransferase